MNVIQLPMRSDMEKVRVWGAPYHQPKKPIQDGEPYLKNLLYWGKYGEKKNYTRFFLVYSFVERTPAGVSGSGLEPYTTYPPVDLGLGKEKRP